MNDDSQQDPIDPQSATAMGSRFPPWGTWWGTPYDENVFQPRPAREGSSSDRTAHRALLSPTSRGLAARDALAPSDRYALARVRAPGSRAPAMDRPRAPPLRPCGERRARAMKLCLSIHCGLIRDSMPSTRVLVERERSVSRHHEAPESSI